MSYVDSSRSVLAALLARAALYPLFYAALFAILASKAITVTTGLASDHVNQPRSPRLSVGARMGMLPDDTLSGFPAPLTFDGSVCLELPAQYDFDAQPTQKSTIPIVYGLMHAALLCLLLMPLTLCHAAWTSLVGCAPSLRGVVPIDDFG